MQLLALDVILFDSGVRRWGRRKVEDNDVMAIVPAGLVQQAQLVKVVEKAVRKLGKDVIRANYAFGEDHTGDPSMDFRIVLTDAASREDRVWKVASGIEKILWDEIRPLENWGLHLYFAFRSESEMAELKDPRWG